MLHIKSFYRTCMELKWYIVAAALIFVGGYFIGFRWDGLNAFMMAQIEGISQIAEEARASDNQELSFFVTIFYKNMFVALLLMFSGIVLGILPIFILLLNGMVIGFLMRLMIMAEVNMFDVVVKGLLPHGVLEILAIVIAAGYGLRFGMLTLQRMSSGYRSRKDSLTYGMWVKEVGAGAVWVTAMLLVAAIIESTITLWLLS